MEPVALIRQHFPNLSLMVDANSAYTLADLPQLQRLDHYQLAMIEQPFAADDFFRSRTITKRTEDKNLFG